MVGPQWLERLRSAASVAPIVATAAPLTNHAVLADGDQTLLSLLPNVSTIDISRRVARVSRQVRPLISRMVGPCAYIRRFTLDAIGLFDPALSDLEAAEADFSQRALGAGLVHVCADDVIVVDRVWAEYGERVQLMDAASDQDNGWQGVQSPDGSIARITHNRSSGLPGSLLVARASLRGIHLMIDGTQLTSDTMGTQVVVMESTRALCRHPDIADLTVAVNKAAPSQTVRALESYGAKVVVSNSPRGVWEGPQHADIVYRPCQVTRQAELRWLLGIARRVVVCQLDCIAYDNPAYFGNWPRWAIYRRANQLAFSFADGVTFLSQTSMDQAATSGLTPRCGAKVVYPGTDGTPPSSSRAAPPGISPTVEGFFLCLGASYKHKNRIGALRIWAAARAKGWRGGLVLAGPNPPEGNSLADEAEFLLAHPQLRSEVWRLGALSVPEREWLYERAALVLYPTLSEGFGLVPFEAARRDIPCLSTRAGALDEVLPTDIPTIGAGSSAEAGSLAAEIAGSRDLGKYICDSLKL